MDIKPVKTEADFRSALKMIESLMGAEADSPEGEKLDVLVTLVGAYEARHYPVDMPDPVKAIRFEMEQRNLTPRNLVPMIGRTNRVYEVLSRKRGLSLSMIRNLHRSLGIPAEVLIRSPGETQSATESRACAETLLHGSADDRGGPESWTVR
jgi:HTH-type transcriptional regulator/antitoxin HigA